MSKGKRKTAEEKVAILKEAKTLGAVETIRRHCTVYVFLCTGPKTMTVFILDTV